MMFATIAFGLLGVVTMVTAGPCPDGWRRFGRSCYYFNTTTKDTWNNAVMQCENHGGHLVTINSQQEHNYIASRAKGMKVLHNQYIWVDGNDILTEGRWMWSSSQEPIKLYAGWDSVEPNGKTSQNCLCFRVTHNKFHDATCNSSKAFYVCEKDEKTPKNAECLTARELMEELVKCRKKC